MRHFHFNKFCPPPPHTQITYFLYTPIKPLFESTDLELLSLLAAPLAVEE